MIRRSFVTVASLGAVATSQVAAGAQTAPSVPGGRDFVEPQSAFDARAFDATLGRSADVRQLWHNLAFKPAAFANIKNSLNGLTFGFGYAPGRIAMAVANHGPSSAYTYADEIWTKYRIGDFFDLRDRAGTRVATNVFYARKVATTSTDPNDEHGSLHDTSIEALQGRGVVFLTCHTAVEEQGRALVAAGHAPPGMSGGDVAADILTHLVPGALVVPSMVATIAVLQQRLHYSYVTIQS